MYENYCINLQFSGILRFHNHRVRVIGGGGFLIAFGVGYSDCGQGFGKMRVVNQIEPQKIFFAVFYYIILRPQ